MRVTGSTTLEMVKALKGIPMATRILGSSSMVELMERAFIPGPTERYTMVNGTKVSNKVTVFGEELRMTLTLANGKTQRLMDMECILGPMGTGMRANGTCASSMVRVPIPLQTAIAITESTKMESLMAKESTLGPKVNSMLATSKLAKSMVMVAGNHRRIRRTAISMKGSMRMILSMEREFILGPVEISIKETTMKMSVTETVKCFGPMAASMKESGKMVFNMASVEWFSQTDPSKRVSSRTTSTRSPGHQLVVEAKACPLLTTTNK